jgi:ribosomal-protein-alanine N-acetyltransferase
VSDDEAGIANRAGNRAGNQIAFPIRPMLAGDIDQVMAIASGLATAPQWNRSIYERAALAENPLRVALVAELSGTLVGFAVAMVIAPEAELESIGVSADAQRTGVGRALLAELALQLRRIGVSALDLEVRESNRAAMELYVKAGFREAGRRTRYYRDPDEDALLLRLELGAD